MRFPITVIMESAIFSVILQDFYSTISKCNWWVLVLISGYFAGQLLLSKFRLLLSFHSPPNGKKGTEWVLPRNRSAVSASSTKERSQTKTLSVVRFNEEKTALCGMHIQTPCTVGFKERERKMREGSALKYSWEAFRILYSHE